MFGETCKNRGVWMMELIAVAVGDERELRLQLIEKFFA